MYLDLPFLGMSLDLSLFQEADTTQEMENLFAKAFQEMHDLELGSIANPDEKRQVGHYWLRSSSMAPHGDITGDIETEIQKVRNFAHSILSGTILSQKNIRFENILLIGIGGSALGPQFVEKVFREPKQKLSFYVLDNTDPDGFDMIYEELVEKLDRTLVIIISKSGSTKETQNGFLETKNQYRKHDLDFGKHAVVITTQNSQLDDLSKKENFLGQFYFWDWVGGRTSLFSAVGLLNLALQGVDIHAFSDGAKLMDEYTRRNSVLNNPAALLANAWYATSLGKGTSSMAILPYKDRLDLFAKYLQQLIMESIGKRFDRNGKEVFQGFTVYGNKGSTDQHAYVQQLREGPSNVLVNFIQVLQDRKKGVPSFEVENNLQSGDYLSDFLYGTRKALEEVGRSTITITLDEINPKAIGALIALYERAVGFYASLININAYHQPGVEAGKKAATSMIELQNQIIRWLRVHCDKPFSATTIAEDFSHHNVEAIAWILRHLASNESTTLKLMNRAAHYFDNTYRCDCSKDLK